MEKQRRDFLKLTGLTGFSLMGAAVIPGYATKKITGNKVSIAANAKQPALNRFPRMVQEYFVHRVREIEQRAEKRRAGIRSKNDALAYIRDVRKKFMDCFGPWPEKTPLNAKVVEILERNNYTIEKVTFESRPDFVVTANLYLPKNKSVPLPGIIGTVGHGRTSKAYGDEQSFAQGLVSKGYVVLLFDPIAQGERIQAVSEDLKPRHGIGTSEHIYAGNQLFLTGESISSWFAWDAIRALDYLLTREEVDPSHIGVTGNSGGGMQTAFLCAIEPRFTMAAPCCWVTTFRRNLENEEPADTEQCLPGVLAAGLDQSDFIACMAPKPVILLSQEKDFFDTRGTAEAYERLKKLYRLLGKEENIQLFTDSGYHAYSKANRQAMYAFFNKATGATTGDTEPEIVLEKPETLWCTAKGQLDIGKATLLSISSKLSAAQKAGRGNPGGEGLKKAVITALKLPDADGLADYRILRPFGQRRKSKHCATYTVETVPGIFSIVYCLSATELFSRVPRKLKRALLYISHRSADAELQEEPFLDELIRQEPDSVVFTCDVRGIGESTPNTCSIGFQDPYGSDYFYAIHSIMLHDPYLGQRTYDVLKVVNWLKFNGYDEIHIAGKGWGALPATFAALLSDHIVQVSLKNALTSYSDIAVAEDYNWPLATLLPGVLKTFDLPDCYRELISKKISQVEPWAAMADQQNL
ncbi:alpha/beta hydrolase family protein [Pedobacter heparinus]|uniref:alpha/beta hydrolase family protein n=1 Tax=Pedobacter heparinus TaxID=984 RepID=UPI00293039F3|nr:alpha/beta hydrolase family protein [Pedobacter heparinus]